MEGVGGEMEAGDGSLKDARGGQRGTLHLDTV